PAHALVATTLEARAFYPDDVWNGAPATFATDLAMAARSIAYVLGGDPSTGACPSSVPAEIARFVEDSARSANAADAWEQKEALDRVAASVFGPPKYIPFTMPGWN